MHKPRPSIVFFGSGPVAAQSLELLAQYCTIEAVITKPQPAHHKAAFPVLSVAQKYGFQTFTPYGKQELSQLFTTRPVEAPLGVVIDYGFIINQDVIDYFPLGIINSHFSLLPEWRGADPITFAILSGQKETGVSLMLITAGMDEGPLLNQIPYELPADINTPRLTEKLIEISDKALRTVLPRYIAGELQGQPQNTDPHVIHPLSYSRKLIKDDGLLDFNKPAEQLEREIRAFIEWPRSRIVLANKEIILTKAHVVHDGEALHGTIWLDRASNNRKPQRFGFHTSHGILVVDTLKPAGKPEMTAAAFLHGYSHLFMT